MLDLLDEYGAKATFFMVSGQFDGREHMVRECVQVISHTHTYTQMCTHTHTERERERECVCVYVSRRWQMRTYTRHAASNLTNGTHVSRWDTSWATTA